MKKNTMIAIANYLSENVQYANDVEKEFLESALAELNADINRGAEQRAAKEAEYAAAHDSVIAALSDTPVTIAELWDIVKQSLPDGFSKSKMQYAMLNLWTNEVVKIEGKPNVYKAV